MHRMRSRSRSRICRQRRSRGHGDVYPGRMKLFAPLALASIVLSLASPALAQRSIAQDTMSMSTPVAVECGFCAMEAYGEIFQRVGASGGLTPADFPLVVQSISL